MLFHASIDEAPNEARLKTTDTWAAVATDVVTIVLCLQADKVVSELVRVSRRHLFLSISLKPHTKVKPCHAW